MSADSHEWHHGPDAGQRGATAREAGFGTFEASRIILPGYKPELWLIRVKMDMIRDGHGLGWEIDGDLLRFTAVNGTWVYRIGEHLEDRRAWVAEWPD